MNMSVTPLKLQDPKKCVLCSGTVHKRLYILNNLKCRRISACQKLEKILNFEVGHLNEHAHKIHLCEKCLDYVCCHEEKVERAHQNIVSILIEETRTKRSARETVAAALTRSVEKLKRLKITDETEKKSRKKISFGEHSYSKSSAVGASDDGSLELQANEIIEELPDTYDLREIDSQLTSISGHKSVLAPKGCDSLIDDQLFNKAIIEFRNVCPSLFKGLLAAFGKIEKKSSKIATIATIYGMILHSRNNKTSLIQRLYSTIVLAFNADNELLTKLNAVHLTLTEDSKRRLINTYGQEAEERVLRAISAGHDGKFNGDNLDLRVKTNDIRLSSKDKDYHFFASDFTLDRVNLNESSKEKPDLPNLNLSVHNFIPSDVETTTFKESLKILLARELQQYEGFTWMKSLAPQHISHEHEEEMAKKSDVFILPVSLNNEARYQDCIHVLDEYEQYLNSWYTKAGRGTDLDTLMVPVGGDQLTRVRLQGAKALRAGSHTASERFDHLHPMVIEMFHTLQDFLEKLCKKFLDFNNAKDPGTLSNLKLLIQRNNVNGKVKSRFKAHEDFIITCGLAYLQDYVQTKFQMDSINAFPKHPAIKDSIKDWTNEPKQKVFNTVMDEVVADLFMPFDLKEPKLTVAISVGTLKFNVHVDSNTQLTVPLKVDNVLYQVKASKNQLTKGLVVNLGGAVVNMKISDKDKDLSLKTYVKNFLQWFFVILQFRDAIKEGDMCRTNITLKHMIPFFYSHSVLSKYLVECVDYVLKTEHTLSPYMSLKVRAATFINVKGLPGKNKAADMHKENEVKYLKSLIRSLGANKTEKAIINITKAGPVILEISKNFNKLVGGKTIKSTHKKKSQEEDISVIKESLKKLKIWDGGDMQIKTATGVTPFDFERVRFECHIVSTVQRLLIDLPYIEEELEDEDEEETDGRDV